jgi:hypothetical protein
VGVNVIVGVVVIVGVCVTVGVKVAVGGMGVSVAGVYAAVEVSATLVCPKATTVPAISSGAIVASPAQALNNTAKTKMKTCFLIFIKLNSSRQ